MLGQGRRPGARARGARPRRLRRDRGDLRRARADPPQGRAGRPPQRGGAGGRAGADRAAARGGRRVRAARARARRARSSRASATCCGATWVPGDLQCDPRAITRAMAAEPGITVRTHTRVDDLGACAPTTSCSPPAPGAPRSPARPACTSRSSRARASSSGSAGRMEIRHKVVDGGYLAAVAAADAALQISTVLETTLRRPRARRLEPRAQGLRHERRPRRHRAAAAQSARR